MTGYLYGQVELHHLDYLGFLEPLFIISLFITPLCHTKPVGTLTHGH
jgi:hypothetical protein